MIQRLSEENKEHSASVAFSPHATLISGVESSDVNDTWEAGIGSLRDWKQDGGLAPNTSALNVPLSDIITNGQYFQVRR